MKINISNGKNLLGNMFFLVGLTSTWMAVQVEVFGVQISIYNLLAILTVVFYAAIRKNYTLVVNDKYMCLYILITFFSMISCIFFLNTYWVRESVKATFKFIMVFLPFVIYVRRDDMIKYADYFFKGIYWSCLVQLFWSILQLIYWYGFNRVLNQEFFGGILNVKTGHQWLTWHQSFRTTGLSWESANLGMCMIFGFFMTRRPIMKIVFFIGLLFTGSRAGLLAMLFSWIIVGCFQLYKKNGVVAVRIIRFFLIAVLMGGISLMIISYLNIVDLSWLKNTVIALSMRIINVFNGNDASAGRHIDYYLKINEVWSKSNLIQRLLGYGTSCSGYPYTDIFSKNYGEAYIWNVESDVVSILVGNGILGFITYYFSMVKSLYRQRNNQVGLNILIAVLAAGVMYLYVRTWVTFALIFIVCGADIRVNKRKQVD